MLSNQDDAMVYKFKIVQNCVQLWNTFLYVMSQDSATYINQYLNLAYTFLKHESGHIIHAWE